MALRPDRLERFARHIVLPEIGGVGQVALAGAHIVLVGLGGIGSPSLQYLAASGIGRLTLIDDDRVDASNLQRQTIYCAGDVGLLKAERAESWLKAFDPEIDVHPEATRIDSSNAQSLIRGASAVLDGCDNFATRLAVSDACVASAIPLVSAAVGRFQGHVASFAGHLPRQPCYRCFVGDAYDTDDCDSCAEDGMLGAMAGWVGSLAAMQALRIIMDGVSALGDPQWGTLHLLDGIKPGMRALHIAKDPDCRACSAV